MATFNKVYYRFLVLKAAKEHNCFLLGIPIAKEEYYIQLEVDTKITRVGEYGINYTPTDVFRLSRKAFAEYPLTDLLELTKAFGPDTNERIRALNHEIEILKETIHVLTKKKKASDGQN